MKLTTAGESHGKALLAIIENIPANLKIDAGYINQYLSLRAKGYGRGERQKIENDCVEILSGVRNSLTIGSPIALCIHNQDYQNWQQVMSTEKADMESKKLTKLRAGHADFAGVCKYQLQDARNILERASARESAIRVAAGSVARKFLESLHIDVCGYVKQVGDIRDKKSYSFEKIKESREKQLFILDEKVTKKATALIDFAKKKGDTVGGIIEVRVKNLKAGFGSCMTYDAKLDGNLAKAILSIQSIKGIEFGYGFDLAANMGSKVHDIIQYNGKKMYRETNYAGGIEGGMSNGEEIVFRVVQKPLPTLIQPLETIDIVTKEKVKAHVERADCCSIESCQIIVESVTCFVIAQAILERLGGDTMQQVQERYAKLG